MEYFRAVLFLFGISFVGTKCDEVCYYPRITDTIIECEDFDNDVLDCSGLSLSSTKGEDGKDVAFLGGTIETRSDILCEYDIEIDIWKQLEIGDEYMYNTRVNFGSSMDNSDAPWYPLLQSLNITKCPVPMNVFEVSRIMISLDCVKDIMCHDFCGQYNAILSFVDTSTKISCHKIEICIVEEKEEKEEE